jgi:polyphosphate kinase 2 (PPK2 family)
VLLYAPKLERDVVVAVPADVDGVILIRFLHASPEQRAQFIAASRGRTPSPETRAKLSKAQQGRTFSAEHRANTSIAKRGKTFSAEHRAKLSAGQKTRYAWSVEEERQAAGARELVRRAAEELDAEFLRVMSLPTPTYKGDGVEGYPAWVMANAEDGRTAPAPE